MTSIILCGKKDDTSVLEALLPALQNYGTVAYVGSGAFLAPAAERPRFLLCDYTELPELRADKGILFFKNSFSTRGIKKIPQGFLCMFESHNRKAAAVLKENGVRAVTCGLCRKDTLSISSFDYNCATICLQRAVETIEGTLLEPHEVSIQLSRPWSPRQALAACTALLLAGVNSAEGYFI